MRIDPVKNPTLKGDELDIFKKPDFTSDNYVESSPELNDTYQWKIFCQPLKDTFEKQVETSEEKDD